MAFCLRSEFVTAIKDALKNKEITPEKLNIDAASRRELLSRYVDANSAKEISLLFEKKLLQPRNL